MATRSLISLLALLALAAPAAARQHAFLAVSTNRAVPGARILVVGRHFPARARVRLYLGSTRLRTLRSNRRGRFRIHVRVPPRAPRLYRLTARARRVWVRVRFRVLAEPKKSAPAPATLSAPAPPAAPPAPPPPPRPAKLVAAGDIACKAGDATTASTCRQGPVSDLVMSLKPDVVATLGDAQYQNGELSNYQAVFDPTWGRFKSLIRPATGNHEYLEQPDHKTAVGHFTYFGSAAGDPTKGYYDYTVGSWHAFVLNTGDLGFQSSHDCFPVSCAVGSAQEQWLRTELAKLPSDACVLAYWHHPRYSSETAVAHAEVAPLYDALYDHGAELILNGHSHTYERFGPRDSAGNADGTYGVREFVVGTGGRSHTTPSQTAGSQVLDTTDFGALELSLSPGSYTFRFISEAGAVVDQGSGSCHPPHP